MADGMQTVQERPKTSAPHVLRAWLGVTQSLNAEGIGKNRKNEKQNFKFRGIDDVLNALSSALVDNGLLISPNVVSREISERRTKDGGVLLSVVVEVEYTFISAIDGSERVIGRFPGEAMDSGDKATNKAMSASYKYMAIETFCIPTEGDNDADATTHPPVMSKVERVMRETLQATTTQAELAAWRDAHKDNMRQIPAPALGELRAEYSRRQKSLPDMDPETGEIDG